MSERPSRCPLCGNTELMPADANRWSCVGSLGCGGSWDPALLTPPPPRPPPADESDMERPRREGRLRARRRLLRRRPLGDAA